MKIEAFRLLVSSLLVTTTFSFSSLPLFGRQRTTTTRRLWQPTTSTNGKEFKYNNYAPPPPLFLKKLDTRVENDKDDYSKTEDNHVMTSMECWSRRNVFYAAAAGVLSGSMMDIRNIRPALAVDDNLAGLGTSPDKPIVILGARGKVGKLCTQYLIDRGLYTRAVTRSGNAFLEGDNKYLTYAAGDVTNYQQLEEVLCGASGVIFAASASGKKNGGDPAHVDYLGVYNTAKACLKCGVPKLVVISAGTATRPESAGFKATNFFVKYIYGDNIMDNKIAGEQIMRDLYSKENNNCAYSVVRPGGLSDGPSVGSENLHVSQGDVYSSEISRQDVALVTIATLLKGKATDFCTFELNQVKGLGKAQGNLPDLPPAYVHAGSSSMTGLLDGLFTDKEMAKESFVNAEFKGNGIESIEKLI